MSNRIDEFEQGLKGILTKDTSLLEVPDGDADCSVNYRVFIRASHKNKDGTVSTISIEKSKVRYPESFTVIGDASDLEGD